MTEVLSKKTILKERSSSLPLPCSTPLRSNFIITNNRDSKILNKGDVSCSTNNSIESSKSSRSSISTEEINPDIMLKSTSYTIKESSSSSSLTSNPSTTTTTTSSTTSIKSSRSLNNINDKIDIAENKLIDSFNLSDQLKHHVNKMINHFIMEQKSRCPVISFIRFPDELVFIDINDKDPFSNYDYSKPLSDSIEINDKQFSLDLLYFEKEYQLFKGILLYLSKLDTPLSYILSKQYIEVGIKPINSSLTTTTTTVTPSEQDSDFITKFENLFKNIVKKRKLGFFYAIIIDLSITEPRTIKRKYMLK